MMQQLEKHPEVKDRGQVDGPSCACSVGPDQALPSDRDILLSAAKLTESGEPFVLITVIKTQGSTPRNAGAKMIFRSPTPEGTIGGGQFELLVIDAAQRHLEDRTCGIEKYVLGADADQCCGGVMEVFFESFGPRQRLVIFGAGHVSQAMAQILATAPLELVIVDDRADWNSVERFPRARRVHSWDEGISLCRKSPEDTLACVMTCSHDTDFELLQKLLTNPPVFLGLIGSRSKRVCLFGRLVASGLDETLVQTVHCPIGVGDTGKEPALVAISIAAQVLLEAKKHARV
jgi:xanthine dehydrogenase accessory factor